MAATEAPNVEFFELGVGENVEIRFAVDCQKLVGCRLAKEMDGHFSSLPQTRNEASETFRSKGLGSLLNIMGTAKETKIFQSIDAPK